MGYRECYLRLCGGDLEDSMLGRDERKTSGSWAY